MMNMYKSEMKGSTESVTVLLRAADLSQLQKDATLRTIGFIKRASLLLATTCPAAT